MNKILTKIHTTNKIWFVFAILISLHIITSSYVFSELFMFGDGGYHATITREIVNTGFYPLSDPNGWPNPLWKPISFAPPITHPPQYYVLASTLTIFVGGVILSMEILNTISIILVFISMYIISKRYLSTKVSLITIAILGYTPLFIWNLSHRLADNTIYFLALVTIWTLIINIEKNDKRYLFLLALFCASLFLIKLTTLPILLAVPIVLLFMGKKCSYTHRFKNIALLLIVIFILVTPYLGYSLNTRGTISYAAPGMPIIDEKILNPWWTWSQDNWENELNEQSNVELLLEKQKVADEYKGDKLAKILKDKKYLSVLQFLSVFPIYSEANNHWYSPFANNICLLFLLVFILGIFAIKQIEYKFLRILVILTSIAFIFNSFLGMARYFFYIAILWSILYGLGMSLICNSMKKSSYKFIPLLFCILFIFLGMTYASEIEHVTQYKDSYHHEIYKNDAGIAELISFSKEYDLPKEKNIFSPNQLEVPFYLDRPIIWDYRLFYIAKGDILHHFPNYNVSYLIISNYMLDDTVWTPAHKNKVQNTKENWTGNSIPIDSDFYQLLNDGSHFRIIRKYDAFTVYEFIGETHE